MDGLFLPRSVAGDSDPAGSADQPRRRHRRFDCCGNSARRAGDGRYGGRRIAPPEGPDVALVLVAGLVARRIVCNLYDGQQVATGQRVGIIRFGSRVDIYCPPPYVPMVVAGQRMVGGETVLADRLAEESPRQGIAQ
jgi:hypothetical protein